MIRWTIEEWSEFVLKRCAPGKSDQVSGQTLSPLISPELEAAVQKTATQFHGWECS